MRGGKGEHENLFGEWRLSIQNQVDLEEMGDGREGCTRKIKIVAKALNGQRYPLPLCECLWV